MSTKASTKSAPKSTTSKQTLRGSSAKKTKKAKKETGGDSGLFEVVLVVILVVVFLIVLSIALYFYNTRYQCANYPSPWCYEDWECKDVAESDPRRFPAKYSQSIAKGCALGDNGPVDPSCTNAWNIT